MILGRLDLSEAPSHPLPESQRVTPSFIHFTWEEFPTVLKKRIIIIIRQWKTRVKVHRSSRWEQDKWAERDSGSSSAGKRGLYIDWQGKTSRRILRILEGWGLYYPRIGGGGGWGRGGQYSTALSSGVAWHLALFTAVECRVVEEGAAFTVPLGAFEVFVPLGPRHWLGALLRF